MEPIPDATSDDSAPPGLLRRLLGMVMIAVGVIAVIASVDILGRAGSDLVGAGESSVPSAVARLAGGLVLAGIGGGVATFGARQNQLSARQLRAKDPRPPVVYLRSFMTDHEMAMQLNSIFTRSLTVEERLARELGRFGPVVALDDPLADIRPLGVSRLAAADEEWREQVRALCAEAELVVFVAGSSPSLLWEVEHVTTSLSPERVVVLVGRSIEDYESFAATWAAGAGRPLPELPERSRVEQWVNRYRALLTFGPGWKPRYTPLKNVDGRRALSRAIRKARSDAAS